MELVEINGHKIEFYNSPEKLSMRRYRRFNKFLMIDNEVGSDFEDYNRRTLKTIEFLKKDLRKEAIQELSNRRQMVWNAFTEYSPKDQALAITVYSIDGEIQKDFSQHGLEAIIDRLDEIGFSKENVDNTLRKVKKKSKKNWLFSFLRSLKTTKQKSSTAS